MGQDDSKQKNKKNSAKKKLPTAKNKKKPVTKKNPDQEIASWVEYRKNNGKPPKQKVSRSLTGLKKERKRAIFLRFGLTLLVSLILIVGLTYYLSPYSLVKDLTISNNGDISQAEIIKESGINNKSHILLVMLQREKITKKLKSEFPAIKTVNFEMKNATTLNLQVQRYNPIGYLKTNNDYQIILKNGAIGAEKFQKEQLDKLPRFVNVKNKKQLKAIMALLEKFPKKISQQIAVVDGANFGNGQITIGMTNQNVIIGTQKTLVDKLKYYQKIDDQLADPAVIDFEIGAFSRPLTENDKKLFND